MIIVDAAVGSKELLPLIRGMGVMCDKAPLQYGDACFVGKGPEGDLAVGVERKTLHDMLSCIEDSRYTAHQRLGMKRLYNVSFLVIEGMWRPREDGQMMESRDGCTWFVCRPHGKPIMYRNLRRYLFSIMYSGVVVLYTRNIYHTAHDICELFHYHSKPWHKHTSLLEIQKLAIPQLTGKPKLVRKWAQDIDGIGSKFGEEAARLFKTPIRLANSEEKDWLKIPGIGVKTAQEIVKEIYGYR